MNAEEWGLAVMLLLGGMLLVHHLGVDVGASISQSLHGLEHLLGSPI